MLRRFFEEQGRLPPESEEGSNIEYKLKLHPKDPKNPQTVLRFQHYVSQLAWRLSESGMCYYELGVDDSGSVRGSPRTELDSTLNVLEEMCLETCSRVVDVDRIEVRKGLWAAEARIEKIHSPSPSDDKAGFQRRCVAFVGPCQVGKSTLISTLSTHTLDIPSGHNRLRLLRHRHEIISGRTSGVSIDYLFYDRNGQCVRMEEEFGVLPVEGQNAPFAVQMVDLPGDAKYVKSVYAYLTQRTLDAVILYDYEQSSYCAGYKDILEALRIPCFQISRGDIDCTCGKGLEALKQKLFTDLFALPPVRPAPNVTVEFIVEHVYNGPEIGLVISGLVSSGSFSCGEELYLMDRPVKVRSIHRMRQPICKASCGQTVAITLQNSLDAASILKGSVLCDRPVSPVEGTFRILEDAVCSGEGLVFMQGNRMSGQIKDRNLILHTPIPVAAASVSSSSSSSSTSSSPGGVGEKYIFLRNEKLTYGRCHLTK